MANKLQELRAKEAQLAKLQEELSVLENNKELKADLKLREEIEALLKKYKRPTSHLAVLFDLAATPKTKKKGAVKKAAAPGRKRRRRKLKTYTHPHSGEVIKTRGGNHRVLKSWKAEHGADVVENWVTSEE